MHAFDVLGDPVRRRILELLATGESVRRRSLAQVAAGGPPTSGGPSSLR